MTVPTEVTIVTLDGRVAAPGSPLLYADDLAALRGDGVFETVLVRDGRARLLESHLRRLDNSAGLMELPAPELSVWRNAVDVALRHWTPPAGAEGALRLIYSRGRESGSAPTGYVMVSALSDRIETARRDGVAALTLDRGLPAAGGETMPWLLFGAKTLSYAVNMAALRYAAQRGAEEVIFVSSDGYILEGPRSTVVITADPDEPGGERRLLTPPPSHGILHGTTQQALFGAASRAGYRCAYQPLRPSDLAGAPEIWLVSSITLAARVHTLDGQTRQPGASAGEFAALVDEAVNGD